MMQISETGFYERKNNPAMSAKTRKKFFTLAEIVVVLIIIMAITALAFGQFGRRPSAAHLDHIGREIERYFSYASHLATVRGKEILICYDPQKRIFFIDDENKGKAGTELFAGENKKLENNLWNFVLPEDIEIIFDQGDSFVELHVFQCQSDGEIHGPEMLLRLDKQTQKLKPSPLSGILTRSKVVHDIQD